MGSFSTEHFGLRGRMGLTFSKRVLNLGLDHFPKLSKKHKKLSEQTLIPSFWAFLGPEMMPGGSGTSWDHSGPLKTT